MKNCIVNVNGSLNTYAISIHDHALMYGLGVFETMRGYGKDIPYLNEHLTRLYHGCKVLGIDPVWTPNFLIDKIRICAALCNAPHLNIRLTVTKGDPASYIITVKPYAPLQDPIWHLKTASIRRNSTSPLSQIKSTCYADNILAKEEAMSHGADEGVFLNESGEIAEGTRTNIFIVDANGTLVTPHLSSGVLPGITRQAVLNIAKRLGIPTQERRVLLNEIVNAREVFCTNSLVEIIPVNRWDDLIFPLGPVTTHLKETYTHQTETKRL